MSAAGAKSQDYNEAIQSVVEHLKSKRNELVNEITHDEVEKANVLGEMDKLRDKLHIIEANLKKKTEFRKDYDKAIEHSEGHFVELMQKSEEFLMRARREALALSHAVGQSQDDPTRACPGQEPVRTCPKSLPLCQAQGRSEKMEEGLTRPMAVIAVQPPEPQNCVNCSTTYACTTIAVPYRANGL